MVHVWDPTRQVGNLYSKTLGLQSTAWDFYFLYPPGVTWERGDYTIEDVREAFQDSKTVRGI